MENDRNRTWALVRDIWIVTIATFMLLHETIETRSPSELIVGAALLMLGLPATFRMDERRSKRS